MQLGTSINATWTHLLLTTRMLQNQRWNLVSTDILVAHEYKNSYINEHLCLSHTNTNICKLTRFSLVFISFSLNNNKNNYINLLNDLRVIKLLNYIGFIGPVILVNVYMLGVQVMKSIINLLPLLRWHLASRAINN